jgi:hypothetical protein
MKYLIFFFFPLFSYSQDTILKKLIARSEIIADINILGTGPGWSGFDSYDVTFCGTVKTVFKGNVKPGDTILFSISFANYSDSTGKSVNESFGIEKGKNYTVFLKGKNGKAQYGKEATGKDSVGAKPNNGIVFSKAKYFPVYNLCDRWLGIRKYDPYFERHLRLIIPRKK